MSVLSKPCGEPEARPAAFAEGRLDARRLRRMSDDTARLLAWGHTLATSRADARGARTAAEGDVGA